MSQLPLVSICIAAYNAERFIMSTLESALAQDYANIEVVVSDDCSTDRTVELVKKYQKQSVKLICQEKNIGIQANYNAVVRASSGKYIVNLDHDDLLDPEYVSSIVPIMESNPRVAFAHCACQLIGLNGDFLGFERSIHGSFIRQGLKEWPRYVFGPRAVNRVMIRRSAFNIVGGYDERFAITGDWKMHRDFLKIGDVCYVDKVLTSFRTHNVGKTRRRILQAREMLLHLRDIDKNWPASVPGKDVLLKKARKHMARGLLIAAAHSDPDEAKELIKYLPSFGSSLSARLLAKLVGTRFAPILISYYSLKSIFRQIAKKVFYKKKDHLIKIDSSCQSL